MRDLRQTRRVQQKRVKRGTQWAARHQLPAAGLPLVFVRSSCISFNGLPSLPSFHPVVVTIITFTMSASQSGDHQKSFDFTGESFDAQAVLRDKERGLKGLPCPTAKTFNNLDEYSKKTFKKTAAISQRRDAQPERKFTSEQVAACVKPERVIRDQKTVLTSMQSQSGPLQLLTRSLGHRIRIRIRRRKAGPPGSQFASLTGLLVAFDKHFNLILSDVDEVISLMSHKSPGMRQECVQRKDRHVSRLFVRGDSVVIVSL